LRVSSPLKLKNTSHRGMEEEKEEEDEDEEAMDDVAGLLVTAEN
jgi:hypothetical protein